MTILRSAPKNAIQWSIFFGYFFAVTLLHLEVSKLLIEPLFFLSRNLVLLNYFNMFAFATLAVWIGVMVKQARQGNRRLVTWIYWGVLIVTVLLADHYLLFKNIEYIHYPQYAFLALLLSKCLDPERKRFCVGKVLFWTTFLGVIDEMFQYFYLCSSYGDYLDFNDLFLNLQGAVVGTLLYYGFKSASLKKRKLSKKFFNSPEFRTIMVFIILIVIFAGSGRLKVSP